MAEAQERLEAARALLERRLLGAAVSDAYHAILYAARAALSEQDKNARTHRGTWSLFYDRISSRMRGWGFGSSAGRRRRSAAPSISTGATRDMIAREALSPDDGTRR